MTDHVLQADDTETFLFNDLQVSFETLRGDAGDGWSIACDMVVEQGDSCVCKGAPACQQQGGGQAREVLVPRRTV